MTLDADRDRRAARCRGDRGDVMLMATVFVIFLLIGAWALVSASQQWGARREAQATAAAAAARAAAAVTPAEVRNGTVTINGSAAASRAAAVWAAAGYSGAMNVSGLEVSVSVTVGVDYAFPAPGFPGSVTGAATAVAARGVQTEGG